MKYTNEDHTFVICAYKNSEYLEECILSLKKQTISSSIIMVTSTPNDFIDILAEKYSIPVYINEGKTGITYDWNFGYNKAQTDLITIAHQDDIYAENYTESLLKMVNQAVRPLIFFSDYAEIRHNRIITDNRLLKVKRFMLKPLEISFCFKSKFIRRRILSLGSPICCPSVTYVRPHLPNPVFQEGFRSNEDWQAWEIISKCQGEFLYCKNRLTYHRIHADSETTNIIGDNARTHEDYVMYRKFWPDFIAKFLVKLYSTSEKSNQLEYE